MALWGHQWKQPKQLAQLLPKVGLPSTKVMFSIWHTSAQIPQPTHLVASTVSFSKFNLFLRYHQLALYRDMFRSLEPGRACVFRKSKPRRPFPCKGSCPICGRGFADSRQPRSKNKRRSIELRAGLIHQPAHSIIDSKRGVLWKRLFGDNWSLRFSVR